MVIDIQNNSQLLKHLFNGDRSYDHFYLGLRPLELKHATRLALRFHRSIFELARYK